MPTRSRSSTEEPVAEGPSRRAIATALLVARILLVGYLLGVALIAFWPTPVDRDFRGLLYDITDFFGAGGMPWADTYRFIEFAANILFFVPFGALVTWVAGRWWLGILLGVLVAGAIELVQAAALPERYSTLQDVLANSLGAALGAGLAILLGLATGLRRRRRRRPRPAPETPDLGSPPG